MTGSPVASTTTPVQAPFCCVIFTPATPGLATAYACLLYTSYFTSGTTGEPKMVAHDFTYPLGHIVTVEPKPENTPIHFNSHEGQEFNLVIEGRMLLNRCV